MKMAIIDAIIAKDTQNLVVTMYKEGRTIEEIMKAADIREESVRYFLQKADVPIRKPYAVKSYSEQIEERMMNEAVTRRDIEEIRRSIKIGDVITIRTHKACANGTMGMDAFNGYKRKAKVVDKSHKLFCIVELPTGIREQVLWPSIIIAKRAGKIGVI
jgi:hypothetical protein